MSPKNRTDAVRDTARHAAAAMKPAAERARPLAKSTGEAARKQLRRTRAWAAPQVERSGQALQHTVAPKVSAMLSSAARRLDPGRARQRRWPKPVGLATLTAAGGAVAAYFRGRRRSASPPSAAADTIKADQAATSTPNGQQQASVGTDADHAR